MKKQQKLVWFRHLAVGIACLLLVISFSIFPGMGISTLKVATEPTFPPFEMESQHGQGLEGFDIDIIQAIGKEANLKIEMVSLPFDGIIPALQSHQVDAAISGMTITAERAQSLSFSRPYFKAGLAIAVRQETTDINNFSDLKGKKIAVQIGTTGAKEAKKIPDANIVTFDVAAYALQELSNGKVDAVINDLPVTLYAIKTGNLTGIKIVGKFLTEEYYGIAFPQNSPHVQAVNEAISRLLANGIYQTIYEKWFSTKPPELPLVAPALENNNHNQSFNWGHFLRELFSSLLQGSLITLQLTAFSVFLGMIGGTLIAIARLSPYSFLRWLSGIYVDFFRGTPLLVQIFIIYFGLPGLFKELGLEFSLDRLLAGIIALTLNSSAYLGEIIRGGIQSIESGQWEASQSLGLSSFQTLRDVIFPQAFRRIIPPLGNEFITMLKDTSLVSVIGFEELLQKGRLIIATTYRSFEVLLAVALVYLCLTFLAARFFSWLERWMNPLELKNR